MYNLSQHEWANVVYSLTLLSFLIASLFLRAKAEKNKMMKQIATWMAVIFVGTLLYNYRVSIFSNFLPGYVKKRGENILEIKKSSDGHFYISVEIKEKKVLFLVDTGASHTILSLKDAERIGLDIKKLKFNIPYQTANGVVYGASVKLDEVKVSDIVFNDIWMSVNKAEANTSLLGMNFLERFKGYIVSEDRLVIYY